MHLVFLGPPASGKGTLSQLLAEKFELIPVSTGVMLRQHLAEETELGLKASKYLSSSRLVPDEIVNGMLSDWFDQNQESNWILDGFPRTLSQARWLTDELAKRSITLDAAVSLEVSYDELLRRIGRRVQCDQCGLTTALDLVENGLHCPECDGTLRPRIDDAEERFKKRYQDFTDETVPVIEYYAERGDLTKVVAEGNPTEVCAMVERSLSAESQ